MRTIRLALLAGAVAAAAACADTPSEREFQNAEFVCEADGKLTERHVEVSDAWMRGSTYQWHVRYDDGSAGTYLQVPGETCRVERW